MPTPPLTRASEIMAAFAATTGLEGTAAPRRYLWTDAFAVCNYVGLYEATGDGEFRQLALRLVDQVHEVLGSHRPDERRTGRLSGLTGGEAARRPTAAGLRIGKPEPERALGEPYDPRREWNGDGQYYHYLTRWMHALNRVYGLTGRFAYLDAAVELAHVAHRAFVYRPGDGSRMYWKMSVDLTRPLVPSMGSHDPLDGLLTLRGLRAAAPDRVAGALEPEIEELGDMCRDGDWVTDDPLGIGSLLADAYRAARLEAAGARPDDRGVPGLMTTRLLRDALVGLRSLAGSTGLAGPADGRLAFRELGLAIGLAAAERLASPPGVPRGAGAAEAQLAALGPYIPLRDGIMEFWLDPENRRTRTWMDHRDINDVMLATALVPDGFLGLHFPACPREDVCI